MFSYRELYDKMKVVILYGYVSFCGLVLLMVALFKDWGLGVLAGGLIFIGGMLSIILCALTCMGRVNQERLDELIKAIKEK